MKHATDIYKYNIKFQFTLLIEVPIPTQKSERSCICLQGGIHFACIFTIFQLDFGTVLTVWYFMFFILHLDDIWR